MFVGGKLLVKIFTQRVNLHSCTVDQKLKDSAVARSVEKVNNETLNNLERTFESYFMILTNKHS